MSRDPVPLYVALIEALAAMIRAQQPALPAPPAMPVEEGWAHDDAAE